VLNGALGLRLPWCRPDRGRQVWFPQSVVQGLQTARVLAEIRAAYVGHELDDERVAESCEEIGLGDVTCSNTAC
jgi:hypothetical protein